MQNKPTAYLVSCRNAARRGVQIYGYMSLEEIAEYLAGKYDQPVADTLALIRSYQ